MAARKSRASAHGGELSISFAPGARVFASDLKIVSESLLTVLSEVTRAYAGKALKWQLSALALESIGLAVTPEYEPLADDREQREAQISQVIVDGITSLENEAARPPFFSSAALKAAERIVRAASDRGLLIGTDHADIPISINTATHIREVLSPRRRYLGSITGFLDTLSVHKGTRLTIFAKSGAVVNCSIAPDLLERAKELLGARVVVFGDVTANAHGDPLAVNAQDVFASPQPKRMKPISAFFGAIPDFTGGLSISEFLDSTWADG